jgi:hypothetical protein
MSPPIPARLAGRPTTPAGLVIPWISVVLADGTAVLGNLHATRADQALLNKLCQICGQPLDQPIVLFASESSHARGQTSEPGMHPECAAYSAKACPMVNGAMTRYHGGTGRVAGKPCSEPGCDCDGWIDTAPGPNRGRPAEPWFAIWVRDYAIGIDRATKRPNAAIYEYDKDGVRFTPLKVRPLTPARPEAGS